MQIQVDSQEAAVALVDYLHRCDCNAKRLSAHVIDASPPPPARTAPDAAIELESYLRVWQILHPEFKIRPFALTGQ